MVFFPESSVSGRADVGIGPYDAKRTFFVGGRCIPPRQEVGQNKTPPLKIGARLIAVPP